MPYDTKENAFKHNCPPGSEVLEPFWLDLLCFGKTFKNKFEYDHSQDCEYNENAEKQVASKENVRELDVAHESNSLYSFDSKMPQRLCSCHLSVGAGNERALLDLNGCCREAREISGRCATCCSEV